MISNILIIRSNTKSQGTGWRLFSKPNIDWSEGQNKEYQDDVCLSPGDRLSSVARLCRRDCKKTRQLLFILLTLLFPILLFVLSWSRSRRRVESIWSSVRADIIVLPQLDREPRLLQTAADCRASHHGSHGGTSDQGTDRGAAGRL